MRKMNLVIFSIIMIIIQLSGCAQDEFSKANIEYQNQYFELCKSVITDTKEISRPKTYEVAKRLQTDESFAKIQLLKKLLDDMKKYQEEYNHNHMLFIEVANNEYNGLITIRDSYSKWDNLSSEQLADIVGEYEIINTTYSMEIDERSKK